MSDPVGFVVVGVGAALVAGAGSFMLGRRSVPAPTPASPPPEPARAPTSVMVASSKLEGFIGAARDPVLMWDGRGRISFANRPAEMLFALEGDQSGERLRPTGRMPGWEAVATAFSRVLDSGHPEELALNVQASRGWRDLYLVLSPYQDRSGKPQGVIGICYDETERRRAERMLRAQQMRTEEAERRRISHELHDEIGQSLTGIKLGLDALEHGPPGNTASAVASIREVVAELMQRVRNLSLDVRPSALDDLGLLPALQRLFERTTERTSIVVDFQHGGLEERLPADVETAAYRITQEALNNVWRHAKVLEASVRVWADEERLTLRIEDRGAGYDSAAKRSAPGTARGGIGVRGMSERANVLGGRCVIESTPGRGTRVEAEFPLPARRGRLSGPSPAAATETTP